MFPGNGMFELDDTKMTKGLTLGKINHKEISQTRSRKKTQQKQITVALTTANSCVRVAERSKVPDS